MVENERHFCSLLGIEDVEPGSRAALLNQGRWEVGEEVLVTFMEGDPGLRSRVRKVAEEWIGPAMANVSLKFVDGGPADVRIAFVQGNGSWSYLGTVCRKIAPDKPTMNYGWLTPSSPDKEVRRVVLHEFGHALGLIHEHQNPNRPINWNRAAVIADLSGPPNKWSPAQIENNMFKHYNLSELTATPTDSVSIMMYPIPASWTNDGFSAGLNGELSETDREFIQEVYPR
jgi:serralysin